MVVVISSLTRTISDLRYIEITSTFGKVVISYHQTQIWYDSKVVLSYHKHNRKQFIPITYIIKIKRANPTRWICPEEYNEKY